MVVMIKQQRVLLLKRLDKNSADIGGKKLKKDHLGKVTLNQKGELQGSIIN